MASVPVSVDQYRSFRQDGYLIVRRLILPEHVQEWLTYCDRLVSGEESIPGHVLASPTDLGDREKLLLRIHMGHRYHEMWERYLLYPRVLDVIAALAGPDVLALQTMLFLKGPGSNGQGLHQDTYYIPSFPDSLIGAWIALDRADTGNGCLWVCPGSQTEPIYPPSHGYGYGEVGLADIPSVKGVGGHSNDDDDPGNELKPIAVRYAETEIPVELDPGDVVFFGGHLIHRSLKNRSLTRRRRSLVNHYINARSFTSWDGGNGNHILARGNTHLEFAQPRFGTPCAALDPDRSSISDSGTVKTPTMMMATPAGGMEAQTPAMVDHED